MEAPTQKRAYSALRPVSTSTIYQTALPKCVGRPRSWRRAPPFGVEQHLLALMQLVLNVTHLRTTMRCWAGRAAPRWGRCECILYWPVVAGNAMHVQEVVGNCARKTIEPCSIGSMDSMDHLDELPIVEHRTPGRAARRVSELVRVSCLPL